MRSDVDHIREYYPAAVSTEKTDFELLGWPAKPSEHAARYDAMLSAIDFSQYTSERPLKLLDIGCGLGLLLDYLEENSFLDKVDYTGVDLLEWMIDEVSARWPGKRFERRDVRDAPFDPDEFDYCLICGIFTARMKNTYPDMVAMAEGTLKALWPSVRLGIGFNSMSKHVDWERDDLFHWPLDEIMAFCKRDLSRHVRFRLDYGLWEVSTLVFKTPRPLTGRAPATW